MNFPYQLLKAMLDLVFFVLVILGTALLLLRRCKQQRKVLIAKILLGSILALLYLFSIAPVKNVLFYVLEKDYFGPNVYSPQKLDVVVVLAGGSYKSHYFSVTMPSNETPSRLIHALQIFKMSGADYLVCSGRSLRRKIDADAMAQAARRLGIPESKIIIESKSHNTMEHARQLNKLFENKSLRIGLVTSGYHMKRSLREFRKYFTNICPVASDYNYDPSLSVFAFIPSSHNLCKSSIAIREIIGDLWYKLRY